MRTTFIRALSIAMLATSISAFAVTGDGKPADAASPCPNSKQDSVQDNNHARKEKKSNKKQNDQQKENNDQLLAIYG
ncbi:MAG TPA: hypothetical protein VI636_02125 [Candidatus Angelobacter sp.]